MALHDTVPDLLRPVPPKPRRTLWALVAALLTVLVAVVVVVVRAAAPGHATVVSIPAPPAITVGPQAEQTATASAEGKTTARARAKARTGASPPARSGSPDQVSPGPIAGASYAGPVILNATGSQLESWNQTSTFCTQESWEVPDGSVYTDSSDDAVLATTGKSGSCAGLISPQAYSSAVIEAYAYFPPLPGSPGTIADWTSIWLTNQSDWPADGELDAVEAEPATGKNAVAYHWGSPGSELSVSTDGYAADGTLPVDGPDLTPGWHVVDIVYTKGFFAVYYDGKLFSSAENSAITGAAVNILITTSVTADNSQVEQAIGSVPVNSDSSPAGMAVKYVKIWAFR